MFQRLAVLLISLLFISCGIEEYYYLPQLPENNINSNFNTIAQIDFPAVSSSDYYYASNYEIYYRIYVSTSSSIITSSNIANVSQHLASDFNSFVPLTDPTNTTSAISMNTFSNRGYFKLELEKADINSILSKNGGTITIQTGSGNPFASFSVGNDNLYRSRGLTMPKPDHYFLSTPDLRDNNNANVNINADVAGQSGTGVFSNAYVSMYIVLAGTNPVNFTPIYSKPTHISIFKLPE